MQIGDTLYVVHEHKVSGIDFEIDTTWLDGGSMVIDGCYIDPQIQETLAKIYNDWMF
jgi:hypothetical protein